LIRDLATETAQAGLSCDVVVIGAGIAGCVLATALAARRLRVVVVESGGQSQISETHDLNRVVQIGQLYRGAEHGRFRALGGTSSRWGGAMIPFQPADLGPHTAGWGPAWPVGLDELMPYLPHLERVFGLSSTPYEAPSLVEAGPSPSFVVKAAKWPPFRLRNVAEVYETQLAASTGPEVWLNAHVTAIGLDESGFATTVRAENPSGTSLEVVAPHIVVASGAIESTRLLLALDRQHGDRLFEPAGQVGRHFHDHLSAPIARIDVTDRRALNRTTGFRFEGKAIRNTRFELSEAARRAHGLAGAFAHIGFRTDGPTGFDGLRQVLQRIQMRGLPTLESLLLLARNSGWFSRAVAARLLSGRVLPPDDALFELHLVTEQQPVATNQIRLAGERDRFGVPLAEIDWRVNDADIDIAARTAAILADFWELSSLSALGSLKLYPDRLWQDELATGGGVYHPGGSLRMGLSAGAGVTDGHLRTFAVPNLRVLSTATFPTGGGANPTMMLMLFALRMADQLADGPSARR